MQELHTAIPRLFTRCTEQAASRMTAHSRTLKPFCPKSCTLPIFTRCTEQASSRMTTHFKIMKPFCPKSCTLPRSSFVQSIVFMIPTLQEQTNQRGEPGRSYRWTGWVWGITVEVRNFRKITHRFRGIYVMYLKSMEKIWKITPFELGNTRILTDYAQKTPQTFGTNSTNTYTTDNKCGLTWLCKGHMGDLGTNQWSGRSDS